jgi:hypothetical protein
MTNLYKFQGVETTTMTDRDGALVGYYRGTPVARKAGNVITLNTGGWFSRTTKVRMNQFSHNYAYGSYGVYQKKGQWFVDVNGQTLQFNGNELTFNLGA